MCQSCWEKYDKAEIDTPEVRAAASLVDDVYASPNGGAGGYAHIVLDDWNLEDAFVLDCFRLNQENPEHWPQETIDATAACLEAFKKLNEAERASALALNHGYWKPNEDEQEFSA